MDTIHKHLRKRIRWYDIWHNNPHFNIYHWILFIVITVLMFTFATNTFVYNIKSFGSETNLNQDSTSKFEKKQSKGKVVGYAQDRILIKYKDSATESNRQDILKSNNAEEKSEIKGSKVKIVTIPYGRDPKEVVAAIKEKYADTIDFVETDDLVSPEALPNDQYYFEQWYYKTIQAEDAWDHAKAANVLIGICDTGFDGSHIDLATSLVTNFGYNTVDDSTNWNYVNFHGTMVAGIAAAPTNNIVGVAGTAWDGLIIPIRITNTPDGNAYVSDAAECITYAADKGARVINLSYRMAQYATIDAAASYAEGKGALTVVAAGNDAIDPGWPDYQTFLAVGATTKGDVRASWSNYGNYIDLVAPGDWILAPYPPTNKYAFGGGTSFAAPIVTGTLGLMFGAKPSLLPSEAKNILLSTTNDLGTPGEDIEYGQGRVNIRKAIEKTLGITINPLDPNPTGSADTTLPSTPTNIVAKVISPYQIDLSWNPSTDNVAVKGYDIFRAKYCSGFSYTRIAQVMTSSISDQVEPSTCYEYYVRAVDSSNNVSYNSSIVKAQTESAPRKSTPPPTFTPTPNSDLIIPSTPTNLVTTVMSPQNVNLSWRGSRDNVGIKVYRIYVLGYPDIYGNRKPSLSQVISASYKIDETTITYSYMASGTPLEPRTYWVSALDEAGNESSLSSPINVSTPGLEGFGNFKGKVLDSTGKPLPGNGITNGPVVSVKVTGTRIVQSTYTNTDGSFLISTIPAGTHTVSVAYKGFPTIKGIITIPNKSTAIGNYTLVK